MGSPLAWEKEMLFVGIVWGIYLTWHFVTHSTVIDEVQKQLNTLAAKRSTSKRPPFRFTGFYAFDEQPLFVRSSSRFRFSPEEADCLLASGFSVGRLSPVDDAGAGAANGYENWKPERASGTGFYES